MMDPQAQKRDEAERAFRVAKACEQRLDTQLEESVMTGDVRKEVASIYVKQLRGEKLNDAEIVMLAYFQAGLLL